MSAQLPISASNSMKTVGVANYQEQHRVELDLADNQGPFNAQTPFVPPELSDCQVNVA